MGISIDFQFGLSVFAWSLLLSRTYESLHKMPALDLEEDNNTTTRLLTLLNVSALKSSKRKRTESVETTPRVKLNKRRSAQVDVTESISAASEEDGRDPGTPPSDAATVEDAVAILEDAEDDRGVCGMFHRESSFR